MSGRYTKKRRKPDKTINAIGKHKIAFCFFAFIVIYNFIVINSFAPSQVNIATYTFYLVDYSLGFCTKLLPGAIYNALFSTTDPESMNIYLNCLYHGFLLALSFVLERFVKAFDTKDIKIAVIIALLFLTGPSTLAFHTRYLGMFDTYWLFFSLGFILFVQNKKLKWVTPVFFALSLLIHLASIVIFIPFFVFILLFEASRHTENKKEYYIILAVSLSVTVFGAGYFVLFEESNLTLTLEQFHEFMNSRNLSEWEDPSFYFDYSLYKVSHIDDGLFSEKILLEGEGPFVRIINVVWSQIYITYRSYVDAPFSLKFFWVSFASSLPILICNYRYIVYYLKKHKEDKIKKFISICLMVFVPASFLCLSLFSPDAERWFGLTFTVFFIAVMYIMYKSEENPAEYFERLKIKGTPFILACYFVVYGIIAPMSIYK